MIKPDVVARKIATAREHLDEAGKIFERPRAGFLADKHRRDLASFYLFQDPGFHRSGGALGRG